MILGDFLLGVNLDIYAERCKDTCMDLLIVLILLAMCTKGIALLAVMSHAKRTDTWEVER